MSWQEIPGDWKPNMMVDCVLVSAYIAEGGKSRVLRVRFSAPAAKRLGLVAGQRVDVHRGTDGDRGLLRIDRNERGSRRLGVGQGVREAGPVSLGLPADAFGVSCSHPAAEVEAMPANWSASIIVRLPRWAWGK